MILATGDGWTYKGYKITVRTRLYFVEGVNDQMFRSLMEAKMHIDSLTC